MARGLPTHLAMSDQDIDLSLGELRKLYGDQAGLFVGRHHARFHTSDVPYHVISRVFQGRCLLVPSAPLNRSIYGVLGRAQTLWPHVKLFAYAFMSNHMHLARKSRG